MPILSTLNLEDMSGGCYVPPTEPWLQCLRYLGDLDGLRQQFGLPTAHERRILFSGVQRSRRSYSAEHLGFLPPTLPRVFNIRVHNMRVVTLMGGPKDPKRPSSLNSPKGVLVYECSTEWGPQGPSTPIGGICSKP